MFFLFLALALNAQDKVRLTETGGVARVKEPACFTMQGRERCVFVTIGANESKIADLASLHATEGLRIEQSDKVGFTVENEIYKADLSSRMSRGKMEDSGTIRGLLFKPFKLQLERTQNRMHWAPSFQRTGANGYSSIATWTPVQSFKRTEDPGMLTFTREGFHSDYPEIGLRAEYRFFSHVPYILFSSSMTIRKEIDMFWLRNQEMTMDAFFTHVAWPGKDGKPVVVDFEARKPLLEKAPLPVDVPWVAFLNRDKGYGFGAVVLKYSATKTAKPVTSINDGADNGKYWDRRIIDQTSTVLGPGDRFEEETAFVLFRAPSDDPLSEFLLWDRKLRHPVRIEMIAR
jgi:hypothetical protein